MAKINPYINFNGNAEEAFNFYKSIFGGEFLLIVRFKDMSTPEYIVPESDANKIMHISLPIGKNLLMGNDVAESMGHENENESRYEISVNTESREETDILFMGLSAGGKIEGSLLMLADENPEWGNKSPQTLGGSPITIVLNVEDVDKSFQKAQDAGAIVIMPMIDEFYGDRVGQVLDPFGYKWMITTHKEDVSAEEMQTRMDKMFSIE